MHYVYLLQLINGNFYTGSTSNLRERLKYHQKRKVRSTRPYLPVRLLYYEVYNNKTDALRRELYLKTGDGRQQLKKQLKNTLQPLHLARSSNG